MTAKIPDIKRLGNYAVTFGAGVSQILAGIFLSRQAFKFFDEQDLKIWFLMLAAMPFLALFELGANIVLPHKLAAVKYASEDISKIASNFVATVVLALSGALVIAVVVLWTCTRLGVLGTHAASLLVAIALASAARILANVMHSLLYAEGDNLYDKSLRVVSILVMTVVITLGLYGGLLLWAMPLGWAAAGVTSICVGFYRQRTRWQVRLRLQHLRRDSVMATLRDALRYIFIALPGQLVFNATPFIIASRLPAQYTVAFGLTQQLVGGISLMASLPIVVTTPRLAGTYRADRSAARELLLGTLGNAAVIAAAALALVAVNIDQILLVWVGHPVPIEGLFLGIYFVVMFFEWQQTTATTATMATGDMNFATVTVISALLVVTTMPLLIQYFGFIGVPLALLIAQALTCHPHNFWKAFRTYHISVTSYLPKLLPAVLVAGLVLGAGAGLRGLALPALVQLLLAGIVTGLLCVAGLYVNRASTQSTMAHK